MAKREGFGWAMVLCCLVDVLMIAAILFLLWVA